MKIQRRPTQSHPLFTALLLLLLSSAGGLTWWIWQTKFHPNTGQAPGIETPIQGSQLNPTDPFYPQITPPFVYQLRTVNNQIHLIPVAISSQQRQPEALLRETLNHLFQDSQSANLGTAIPVGTHLEILQVKSGAVYIDLSNEFKQGGGSTSMVYRVAQVLYTATSLNPNAQVYLSIEGQPIDEDHPLGGEGLMLNRPLTRKQMVEDFPWLMK